MTGLPLATTPSAPAVYLPRLAAVNTASFLAQVVQIGTVPALFALQLDAAACTPTTIGAVAAAPWLAVLLSGHWVPRCVARVGCRATAAAGLGLSALALAGALLGAGAAALFALNFLFGVGLILRWIACDTWIVTLAPPAILGRAIGVHETLMGCGIAAAPVVLAAAGESGPAPLLASLALLALSAVCVLALRGARVFGSCAALESGVLGAARAVPTALAAGFAAGLCETASISFLPVFANRGALGASAVLALGAFGLGSTLLQVPLGWLADRLGHRRAQAACATLVIVCVCALAPLAHSGLLLPLLFLLGAAAGGLNTLAVIEAGRMASTQGLASTMAAVAVAYTIGAAVGPVLAGYASASGALSGFAFAICAGAGVHLVVLTRQQR